MKGGVKLHRRVIDVASRLVPARFRPDWKREWEAEILHREARIDGIGGPKTAARWELFRRSSGSIWDAVAMQPRRLEEDVFQDVRFGLRTMWRSKGWTLVVIGSLAVGIGANTALFSVVDAALVRELPVDDPGSLVFFEGTWDETRPFTSYNGTFRNDDGVGVGSSFAYSTFERFREQSGNADTALSGVIAFAPLQATVRVGDDSESVSAQLVSGNYFDVLGVGPALGRTFTDLDDRRSAEPAAVISHDYWQRRFGGDPNTIGETAVVNGVGFTIIGISAPGFSGTQGFGTHADYSIPISLEPLVRPSRTFLDQPWSWWVQIMARSRSGISRDRIDAEFEPVFQASARDAWDARPSPGVDWVAPRLEVRPGARGVHDSARRAVPLLRMLTPVFGFLLLIVCLNVANLLLARSAGRSQELGMRLAVGAGKLRLVRQLLTESVLLAMISAGLGVLLAYWGKGVFARVLELTLGSAAVDLRIDVRVLAFAVGVSFLAAILFGLAPAFRYTRWTEARRVITTSDRSPATRSRFSRTMMMAQVAMSVILLVGAGLFVRTLANLHEVDLGFNSDNLLLFRVDPVVLQYDPTRIANLYEEIRSGIDALPGVVGTSYARFPLVSDSGSTTGITPEASGDSQDRSPESHLVRLLEIAPNFMETMQVAVRQGRDLDDRDGADSAPVALINEKLAAEMFGNENPIGQRFAFDRFDPADRVYDTEVVGIVPDVRVSTVQSEISGAVFIPVAQGGEDSAAFTVRTTGDPLALVPAVREIVRRIDPNLPLGEVRTQETQIAESFAFEFVLARATAGFGLVALLLASIGLYGLMSYNVASRVPEIGIRMALGAERSGMIRMIMLEGSRLVLGGIVLGLGGSLLLTPRIAEYLYGVDPVDPATLALVAALLLATAAAAAFIPARRASEVDPMEALRET